jgi:cleavage and polyadenylation specificity factor subunit 3
VLRYKGKTIMLDCGVLPSFSGLESLPWLGELEPAEVDIVFITHFHLDHAAALPYFTERLTGACASRSGSRVRARMPAV